MKKIFIPLAILAGLFFLFMVFQPKPVKQIEKEKALHEQVEKKDTQKASTESPLKYETNFERKSREMGIVIGTPADDVLAIRGKPPYPSEVVGKDENGLIVEWEYPDGIYVMRRWAINGVTCYRVAEMKL
ncbi:hypothetical protein AMJ44_14830 [candidate division WOR-1 bacterium DG_54_3]|uniref:Uncharacterized protein n=1 Tax=candidate division WOR-1 bacterium DG_54_3 TaxID=1703775 RepID=A0A0S7XKU2_UNCSA|nr:MAG: hypothetical protein AMJ44_14830 [candidate division WOR-1 bacterium DG_54_3]